MDRIEELLVKLQRINDISLQKNKEARLRGEQFNVFNILNLSTNETRTHSAFLAELLDPCGSHGCGSDFLREFLNMECLANLPFNLDHVIVETERSIGNKNSDATEGGRLDIVVESDNAIIVIENKIYAIDQENQLQRYRNYLNRLEKPGRLLYLTLDGHEYNMSDKEEKLDYSPISYASDILSWLQKCAGIAIQKPLVRETIVQYINLIKQLTNQTMENTDKEAMFRIMAEYPDAVAQMFHTGHTEYAKYVFDHYVRQKFMKFAAINGLVYYDEKRFNDDGFKGYYFRLPEWKASAIYIQSEKSKSYTSFYCGISHYGEKNYFREKTEGLSHLSMLPESEEGWPLGWHWLDKYQNWDSFTVSDMINGKYNEYIEGLILEILKELKQKSIILP